MNKNELVEAIAMKADISKAKASEALDAACEAIIKSVAKDEDVTLVGFGTFSQTARAERPGRNPLTGEAITIAASKGVKFKAGKAFKDALN